MRALDVGRDHRRVAEVDDLQFRERVNPGLEVRPRRGARGADCPRREPSARPIRNEIVRRRADDRDVGVGQLSGVLRVRRAAEAERAGVIRFLTVLAPALERIERQVGFVTIRKTIAKSRTRSTREIWRIRPIWDWTAGDSGPSASTRSPIFFACGVSTNNPTTKLIA